MKKTIYLGSLLALVLGSTLGGRAAAPKGDKAKTDPAVVSYFISSLKGDTTPFEAQKTPLKTGKVAKMQAIVWNSWRAANAAWEEERLPALKPLEQTQSGSFDLTQYEPEAVMPYYYGTKGDAKPEAGWPLFLYLHGSGPKAHEWSTGYAICSRFDDAPSAYFIPQIPNEGGYYRWWQVAKQRAWEKLLRQALLSGEIDPNRVYCFGISEGGYGSQRLASFYADYLAAAGPIAGGEPLQNAPAENCANLAFSLRTGSEDRTFSRNVLTQNTLEEFDRLEGLHPGYYAHNIQVVPGATHTSVDYKPTTPWMKGYTRNPYPKYLFWENFEMDGQYRSGFYNLYVKQRSNDNASSRSCYEMSIEGNTVDLKVTTVTYRVTESDAMGIPLRYAKTYTPATKGEVVIYLNDQLVDLSRPVTVVVNGREVFCGLVELNVANLVNSCAEFYDPMRLYPASVDVTIQ